MFSFDRDTATIIAVAVCIAATFYLYKEVKKTREELKSVIASKSEPVQVPAPVPVQVPAPVPVPVPAVEPATATQAEK